MWAACRSSDISGFPCCCRLPPNGSSDSGGRRDMNGIFGMLQGKAGMFLLFFAAIFILERLFPAARPRVAAALGRLADQLRRLAKNLAFAGLNAAASPLIVIPISTAAAQWSLDWRPDWFTGAAALAVDLVLLDLWIYWW